MTPNELYARIPEKVDGDLEVLRGCYYNHIVELDSMMSGLLRWNPEKNTRIEIRYYKDFDFDGRRFWRLASVWFDKKPVMIIRNAGREGDDHHSRFITDMPQYSLMLSYIIKEILYHEDPESPSTDVVSPDQDIADLDTFYGNSLDGHFERYRY